MEDWEREQVNLAKESWEDDDIADSWDAEEEEDAVEEKEVAVSKPNAKVAAGAAKPTQKQAIQDPLESEQDRKERLNRLIQESDLENAMALFGISKNDINVEEVLDIKKAPKKDISTSTSNAATNADSYFESANPQNWSEFETLSALIVKKMKSLESSKHYPNFLETLFRGLIQERDVPEIRKLANMASELLASKQRDKLAQMNSTKKKATLVGASKKSGRSDMMDFDEEEEDLDGF